MGKAKGITVAALTIALLPGGALGLSEQCVGSDVTVTAQDHDQTTLACEAVTRAEALFAECAVPKVPGPTRIMIVDQLPAGCFGLYHCHSRLIEVLSPDALHDVRASEGIFAHLTTNAHFQSIIVHELAHAATQHMPCPFDSCLAGPEYIAYLMQMKSLDPQAQAELVGSVDMDTPVFPEGFHPFILLMAPDIFSQRVWAHHHQQDDPCGFVDALVRGDAFLDFQIFDPD